MLGSLCDSGVCTYEQDDREVAIVTSHY
jgi:hypothetical protein